MKPRNANRFRISIFVKILIPIFVAMVAIHVIVAATIFPLLNPAPVPPGPPPAPPSERMGGHSGPPDSVLHGRPPIPPHLRTAIREKIDSRASEQEIRKLFDRGEAIVFEGDNENFSNDSDLPGWKMLVDLPSTKRTEKNEIYGLLKGRPFFGFESSQGKWVVYAPPHGFPPMPSPIYFPPFWWMLTLQVSGVLLLCYAVLAWQLRPIKKLSDAMAKLSRGDLGFRIQLNDSGEFGRLGDGFNDMAEKISRMLHAKEELMLGVSHEIRSPLASINVIIEMIQDEKRREQIRHHLKRIDSLVEELLESHRIENQNGTSKLTPIDWREIALGLSERYESVRPGFKVNLSDSIEYPFMGDPRLIDRLLSNLVENAMKYSRESNQPVELEIKGTLRDIQIEVRDSGPGIPVEDQSNIFEPFYRVDKSRNKSTGGFGLGLYLCAKIAKLHEGQISVRNRPEGGCVFTVTFPLSPISAAKAV